MKRLVNKVAIITGAASGMGETTARVFAREVATVIITDVQEQAIKDLVADIQGEYGDVALGIVHDIADEQSWAKVTQEVVAKFGKIDILVNNAAIGGKDWKYEDASLEEWQKVMKVNAEGVFLGICAVVPYMKKNDISSIVNINTLGVHVAGEGIAGISYSASKGAVDALTHAMASRLGKYNVRVNSVSPGPILTLWQSNIPAMKNWQKSPASTRLDAWVTRLMWHIPRCFWQAMKSNSSQGLRFWWTAVLRFISLCKN